MSKEICEVEADADYAGLLHHMDVFQTDWKEKHEAKVAQKPPTLLNVWQGYLGEEDEEKVLEKISASAPTILHPDQGLFNIMRVPERAAEVKTVRQQRKMTPAPVVPVAKSAGKETYSGVVSQSMEKGIASARRVSTAVFSGVTSFVDKKIGREGENRFDEILEEGDEDEYSEEKQNASNHPDKTQMLLANSCCLPSTLNNNSFDTTGSGKTIISTEPGSVETFHSCIEDTRSNKLETDGSFRSFSNSHSVGVKGIVGSEEDSTTVHSNDVLREHVSESSSASVASAQPRKHKLGLRSVMKIAMFIKRSKRRNLRKNSLNVQTDMSVSVDSMTSNMSNSFSNSISLMSTSAMSEQAGGSSGATPSASVMTNSLISDESDLVMSPLSLSSGHDHMKLPPVVPIKGSFRRTKEPLINVTSANHSSDSKPSHRPRRHSKQTERNVRTAPPCVNRRFDVNTPTFSMLDSRGRCYRFPEIGCCPSPSRPFDDSIESLYHNHDMKQQGPREDSDSTSGSTSSLPSLPNLNYCDDLYRYDNSSKTADDEELGEDLGRKKSMSANDLGLLYVANQRTDEDFRMNFVISPRKLTPPPRRKNNIGRIFCFPNCLAPFDRSFMI